MLLPVTSAVGPYVPEVPVATRPIVLLADKLPPPVKPLAVVIVRPLGTKYASAL